MRNPSNATDGIGSVYFKGTYETAPDSADYRLADKIINSGWVKQGKGGDMTSTLMKKIYAAFKVLNAPIPLLAIIGSIGDTLDDEECESLLDEWIMTGEYLHPVQEKKP